LYARIIHDAAGHFFQSVVITSVIIKPLAPIYLIPIFGASFIDIDHFYAAKSFSLAWLQK
jgi:hypothetical protein